MERRGWLWKKKSSDKIVKGGDTPAATSESTLFTVTHLGDQLDNCNNKNYVQISMESYTHMSGLEDQVVSLEHQVKALEAKLSTAYSELTNKNNIVKQQAKVAEEAVSGWEKADADVVSLRNQLESLSLSKIIVDEKAAQLDEALKECMKQMRTLKEESEQKLQELILMKSQQWEKFKLELEAQVDKLEEGLREEAAQNAVLLRSLQESSNRIVKLKEEKSETEVAVELLKKNVQSKEKEITSLNYELHMISKELDIRNEEKNMIMRSAEVANKQHIEDVKNIAKLESECQRLRSLLQKKLPGPAALAQMKLEVESAPHLRRTFLKTDSLQKPELLSKQLEALEEETKTLKEALASSNAELQASRNLYAITVGRLKSLEAEKSVLATNYGKFLHRIRSNPPSITSISDNGHEDPESPVDSSAASVPDHSDRNECKFENRKRETISELMDDFLEVERMACLSDIGSVPLGIISSSYKKCFDKTIQTIGPNFDRDCLPIFKRLQSIISMIVNSETKGSYIWKYFEDLQATVCELRPFLPTTSNCFLCLKSSSSDDDSSCQQSIEIDRPVAGDGKVDSEFQIREHQDVATAVSSIRRFVLTLGRETLQLQRNCYDGHKLDANSEEIYISLYQLTNKTSLEFVLQLSNALTKTIESHLNCLKGQRVDVNSSTSLAEIQLKCMTESYKSLETHVEELESENKFLKEKMDELKNDLADEKQHHHEALVRYKEIEEKIQRDKCLVCASNNSINVKKDAELVAAEKKLAECQETLLVLSRQLQAMCPQLGLTMSHQNKRLQMNEKLVKPTYRNSNSYGSCNSNEIDQAEACSLSSDTQRVTDEFSSHNSGSTPCLSDTEGNFSLSSSVGSSHPVSILGESNSCSSATGTEKKNAHGLSHFFLLKEKSSH